MSATNYRWGLIACLLLVCPASAAPDEASKDLAKENADLKARIETLERQMKLLQIQVGALMDELRPKPGEIKVVPIPPQKKTPQLPKPEFRLLPAPNSDHPDWKEGQINGVRFYLIPIDDDAKRN